MGKIIIGIEDGISDERAMDVVTMVIRQGKISVAPGNEGHMQYCYHTTIRGVSPVCVAATRRKSGTHKFLVRKDQDVS